MKLTKRRIKEIIKEEMELASSKMDLKTKMKDLSTALADNKFKIEPAEAEEVDRMITRILAAASAEDISTTDLRKANQYVEKFLNVDTLTEITDDYVKSKFYTLVKSANTPEEKLKVAQRIMSILRSNDPEQLKALFPKTFSDSKKDSWTTDAKKIADKANRMNPSILQNIEDQAEENDVDGVADAIGDAIETAVEDTPAEAEIEEQPVSEPTEEPPEEPAEQPPEQPQADEEGVVDLPSGDQVVPSQFDELTAEFKKFADDDDGFMMKAYLKDQDASLLALRSALRKFIGEEGIERSLREQEEEPNTNPEDKTEGSRKSLVKYVSRYRRDMNDTSKVMAQYIQAAKEGTYKAEPILNKLKLQLQKLQDDNTLIIRDLKALAGLRESLIIEQESREDKIAKVRKAYDEIVTLLRPLLNISAPEPEPAQPPTEPEQQAEELVLEDVYLEQVSPTEEELQSYASAVKDALTAIDSIKGYFRLAGTFNRPVEEVRGDFVEYIQDYKNTMSDLVLDLRSGVPDQSRAQQYADSFARLAKQIQEDFGVSPRQPIRTPEVIVTVDDEDDTAAINPSPEAERIAQDSQDDRTEVDPDATTLADPTELMRTEIPDLSREITRHAPKKGPITQAAYASLIEKDEQFADYYSRFLALLSGINRMSKIPDDEPREIRNSLQLLWKALSGEIQEQREDEKKPSIFKLQELTYLMFRLLKSFSAQTSESDVEKFYKLYQKALILVRALKNTNDDLVFFDDDDFKNTVLNNTEYFIIDPSWRSVPTEIEESKNLLERLIKEELKVLNGKKMVRN